jgi:Zn finger protein HypA/HybF involved in hydrogenase expression
MAFLGYHPLIPKEVIFMPRIHEFSDEKIRDAIQGSRGCAAVLESLGLPKRAWSEQKALMDFIERNKINIEHFQWGVCLAELDLIFSKASCFREVAEMAGLCGKGRVMGSITYKKLKDYATLTGVDTSHFDSAASKVTGTTSMRFTENEVFCRDSPVSKQTLKKRYMARRKAPCQCDVCGISEWMGIQLGLDLDHVDGNNTNNTWENLRLLCPNCHSQTATHAGRNLKMSRSSKAKENRKKKISEFLESRKKTPRPVSKNKERKKSPPKLSEKKSKGGRFQPELHEARRKMVEGCDIDLTRHGRNQELSRLLGIHPVKAGEWLRKFMPEKYALLKRKDIVKNS